MNRRGIIYNSPVVLTFALLSLAILLISQATGGWLMDRYFTLYRSGWTNPLTYLRLFTHVLGHASGEHYSGNMMLLLLTGPMLEEKYGSRRLLLAMLCTAVTTGLLHLFLFPDYGVLGASGIVFAFILLSSITGSRSGQIPLTLIVVAVLYLGG
ncbi:MAG: rhomboid family intramembrane serine protease, partial [Oscillospiraceae bacterium]